MTSLDFGHSSCKMGMELWFLDILTWKLGKKRLPSVFPLGRCGDVLTANFLTRLRQIKPMWWACRTVICKSVGARCCTYAGHVRHVRHVRHEALRDLGVESCWIFVLGKGTVVLEACWSGDHPQVIRIRFDGPLSKLVLEDVFKIGFAWWFHHVSPLYVYRIIELYGYV